MSILTELIGNLFIILGIIFIFITILGIVKIKDNLTKIHAVSITDSLALPLCILGLIIKSGFNLFSVKLFVLMIIVIFISPTITHNIAKIIYNFKTNKDENEFLSK